MMREGLQGRVTRALAQPGIQEQQALLESLTDNRDRLPSSSLTPSFILRCFRSGGCVAHCGSTAQARRPAFAGRASLRGGRRRHRIPAGSACWQCGGPAARWPRCNASRGSTLNVRTGRLRTHSMISPRNRGSLWIFQTPDANILETLANALSTPGALLLLPCALLLPARTRLSHREFDRTASCLEEYRR